MLNDANYSQLMDLHGTTTEKQPLKSMRHFSTNQIMNHPSNLKYELSLQINEY